MLMTNTIQTWQFKTVWKLMDNFFSATSVVLTHKMEDMIMVLIPIAWTAFLTVTMISAQDVQWEVDATTLATVVMVAGVAVMHFVIVIAIWVAATVLFSELAQIIGPSATQTFIKRGLPHF